MNPTMQIQILTTKQAAEILNVSVAWLERQRWLGTGPSYVKVGRSVRYLESSIIEYLKSNTVNTADRIR